MPEYIDGDDALVQLRTLAAFAIGKTLDDTYDRDFGFPVQHFPGAMRTDDFCVLQDLLETMLHRDLVRLIDDRDGVLCICPTALGRKVLKAANGGAQ
jgi:hypothetical protein